MMQILSEVWLWFQELAVNGTMRWSSGIVLTGHLARWLRCRHTAEMEKVFSTM